MKLTLKMSMEILTAIKKCLISVIIQLSQNTMIIQNERWKNEKWKNGKMKDETRGFAIEEFVGLTPKIHSFLVGNNEHKKAKIVNKNVVATVSHIEYKHVLLNNKCLRQSMNIIQSKDHRIGTYEINKISLSCFDDNIYPKQWI